MSLKLIKESILKLSLSNPCDRKKIMFWRKLFMFIIFAIAVPAVVGIVTGFLSYLCTGQFDFSPCISYVFFMICLSIALSLCQRQFFKRNIGINLVFIVILALGIFCYDQLSEEMVNYNSNASKNQTIASNNRINKTNTSNNKVLDFLILKFFSALHNSHTAASAFFPSRGAYEIDSAGTVDNVVISSLTLFLYSIFHASVYIFAGYFIMTLWGYRTLNRLHFFLTRDSEKYIFWCKKHDDNMIMLAKSIRDNKKSYCVPVFSVEEDAIPDAKLLFQEMNFQNFCLKVRKPEQIHESCLNAPVHFFISDDYNWNIRKANAFLIERKNKKVFSPAKLYIRINDSTEAYYYEKWADIIHAESAADNQDIEIKFINESELIAREMQEKYPMLKCPGIEIDYEHAKIKNGKFKTMILGLGEHGTEILKAIIEDGQFVHLNHSQDIPDFSVEVFEKQEGVLDLFFAKYPEAQKAYNINTGNEKYQTDVFSQRFYEYLMRDNVLASFTRIVICLGNDKLNLNAAIMIEKIAKYKCISLKDKLFVVLTENNAFGEVLSGAQNNLAHRIDFKKSGIDSAFNMTIIGNLMEIYAFDRLLKDSLVEQEGKLLNLIYILGDSFDSKRILSKNDLKWFKSKEEAISYYNLSSDRQEDNKKENLQSDQLNARKEAESNNGNLKKIVSYFDRKSSIASAKGYRNIILLQENCSVSNASQMIPKSVSGELLETLAETEHLRWNAYHFMQGIRTWTPANKAETSQSPSGKPNDIFLHMRHAALVSYDELPEVDALFDQPKDKLQNCDREIIKHIQQIRSI